MEKYEDLSTSNMADRVADDENGVADYSPTVADVAKEVADSIKSAISDSFLLAKTAELSDKNRYVHLILSLVVGGVGVVALYSTLAHLSPLTQAIFYLMFAGLFVSCDPLMIFNRFMVIPTRLIILGECITMVIILTHQGDVNVAIVCLLLMLMGMIIIRVLNKRLVVARNWKHSEFVMKSERELLTTAESSWQGRGKWECRTLLSHLGYPTEAVNDDVLDMYVKYVYTLGHAHGMDVYISKEDEIRKQMQININYHKATAERWEDDYNDISNRYDDLKERNKQLTYNVQYLKNLLAKANEPTEESEEESQEITDEKILESLNNGMSQRNIAEQFGISRYKVGEIIKKYDWKGDG